MRRLLLLPVLALALSACDSGTDEVSSVTITRAEITSLSFDGSDSADQWDDLYLLFRVGGVSVRSTRSDAQRVRATDLSYEFDFGSDIDIIDLGESLVIQALNRESNQADDILIGATQPVSLQSLVDSSPSAREFSSVDGNFRVRLNFDYN